MLFLEGSVMRDYRRGKKNGAWSKLWHWHELCDGYPVGTFAIRHDQPSDDELCARCHRLANS
jgi:hypothetical protein